jgi:hypothetical protein
MFRHCSGCAKPKSLSIHSLPSNPPRPYRRRHRGGKVSIPLGPSSGPVRSIAARRQRSDSFGQKTAAPLQRERSVKPNTAWQPRLDGSNSIAPPLVKALQMRSRVSPVECSGCWAARPPELRPKRDPVAAPLSGGAVATIDSRYADAESHLGLAPAAPATVPGRRRNRKAPHGSSSRRTWGETSAVLQSRGGADF